MMRKVLIALLLVVAGGLGYLALGLLKPGSGNDPYGAPFTLTDYDGKPITEAAMRGHPSMVFFGFTHCPEICPTTLYEMSQWFDELGEAGKPLHGYFISIDPERDTPAMLKDYITAVTDRVTGISGDPDKVWAMAKSYGIYWKKVPLGGDDYTMDHTATVLLLRPDGSFFGTIAYGEGKDTALVKLRRLLQG